MKKLSRKDQKKLEKTAKFMEFFKRAFGPATSEEIKQKNLAWDRKYLGGKML